jgi:hypothetical protein
MASFNKNAVVACLMLSLGLGSGRCIATAPPPQGEVCPKPALVLKAGEPIHTAAYSPDGKLLFAVGDQSIRVWDLATRTQVRKITVDGGIDYHTAAFSQDRKRVAVITNGRDDVCIVVETATGKYARKMSRPPSGISAFTEVALSSDGALVAVAREREVHFWEVKSGTKLRTLPTPPGIEAIAFSPDGQLLATGSDDSTARLWDVKRGKEVRRLFHPSNFSTFDRVWRLAFSPDGRLLATATCREPGLQLWDVATGKKMKHLGPFFGEEWERIQRQAEVKRRPRIRFDERAAVRQLLNKLTAEAVVFSPDGKWLASAGYDQHIRLWEVATGKEGASWQTPLSLPLAFSPDGSTLTSGGTAWTAEKPWSSSVALWDWRLLCQGVRGASAPLSSKELERCWNDLSSDNAARAGQAIWLLASVPEQAVEKAVKYLDAVPAATPARIRQAVLDLSAERFQVRELARRNLAALGERARPALVAALRGQLSADARKHLEALLAKVNDPLSPERLRHGRLIEILEQIASRPAQQILKKIASGCLGESASRDATGALQRLSNIRSVE